MDEATQKIVDQVEKLLRVAAKTPNEAEAAAFTSKANALLTAYNLTVSDVEAASSGAVSGRRLDEQVSGGMYKYQQKLWRNIAQLNFCMYWSMVERVRDGGSYTRNGRVIERQFRHVHRLVGRQVNVIATKNMASYLHGVIERNCRERLQDRTDLIVKGNNQYYSRWAVSFREGMADRIVDKVQERRDEILSEEEKKIKAAARKAKRDGLATSNALTVAGLKEREEQANYDFLNGEGAWARREAAAAEREKRWAEERAEEAKAQAEAEKEYTEWAEANPEEAAKLQRQAETKARAAARRRARSGGGWGRSYYAETAEDVRRRSGGYSAGYEAGAKVSIDQQVDTGARKRIGHG